MAGPVSGPGRPPPLHPDPYGTPILLRHYPFCQCLLATRNHPSFGGRSSFAKEDRATASPADLSALAGDEGPAPFSSPTSEPQSDNMAIPGTPPMDAAFPSAHQSLHQSTLNCLHLMSSQFARFIATATLELANAIAKNNLHPDSIQVRAEDIQDKIHFALHIILQAALDPQQINTALTTIRRLADPDCQV